MKRSDGFTTFGILAYSAGLHAAVFAVALGVSNRTSPPAAAPAQQSEELFPVDLAGPKGEADGVPDAPPSPGSRAASRGATRAARQDRSAPARDREVVPTSGRPELPAPNAPGPDADKEAEREKLREAVRRAMLAPESASSASGPSGPAPKGTPDGKEGAKGPPGAGLGRYKGMLSGWFAARIAVAGGGGGEAHQALRAVVAITIAPDRRITGFSVVTPSGNAAYDARINGRMQSIVASGATVPPPPEDEEVPRSVTLAFTCKPTERCY